MLNGFTILIYNNLKNYQYEEFNKSIIQNSY